MMSAQIRTPNVGLTVYLQYVFGFLNGRDISTSIVCILIFCAVFYGLCETLFKLDQGHECSTKCNTETMKIGSLECYYLLQPSEKGPMLLRVQATPPALLYCNNNSRHTALHFYAVCLVHEHPLP